MIHNSTIQLHKYNSGTWPLFSQNNIVKLWSGHCGRAAAGGLSQALATSYDELLSKWHTEVRIEMANLWKILHSIIGEVSYSHSEQFSIYTWDRSGILSVSLRIAV